MSEIISGYEDCHPVNQPTLQDADRAAFEREYASRAEFVDAISLCKNPDGTYQQALARMCFKWFCKGQAAKADSRAINEALDSSLQTNQAMGKKLTAMHGELQAAATRYEDALRIAKTALETAEHHIKITTYQKEAYQGIVTKYEGQPYIFYALATITKLLGEK